MHSAEVFKREEADDNMFVRRSANEWIREASKRPNPRCLWCGLWYQGEVACLFADTNAGKSIYAIQIADSIARQEKVLYFDFEMSDKQFQLRYTDEETGEVHQFNEGFIRLEFTPTNFDSDDLERIMKQIGRQVDETGAKILIIDNISWISNRSESGDAAGFLMQKLIELKRRRGLSILVLAHTPKRNINTPLTQNSLAGSKKLANFMDSMFAIGFSRHESNGRYIKQIKVRSSELIYGADNVITARLEKTGSVISLLHDGYGCESDLLDIPDNEKCESGIQEHPMFDEIKRRIAEGECYNSIQAELKVSSKTIARIAKALRA